MKHRVAAILMVLCLMLLQTAPARSGQEITIVRGQDFPPYHYLDENGIEKGVLIDLLLGAGKRLDLSIRFKQLPWSRCLHLVKVGQADAMMNLFRTEERMTFMVFSETPLTREVNRLFALKKSDLKFTGDLNDLKGLKIGAVRNYSYGKTLDSASDRLNLLRFETEKTLIKNLAEHRCDAIIGNEVVIRILKDQIPGAAMTRPVGPKITDEPLYIGFSRARGHKVLAGQFSQALRAVKASPDYRKILKTYGL